VDSNGVVTRRWVGGRVGGRGWLQVGKQLSALMIWEVAWRPRRELVPGLRLLVCVETGGACWAACLPACLPA